MNPFHEPKGERIESLEDRIQALESRKEVALIIAKAYRFHRLLPPSRDLLLELVRDECRTHGRPKWEENPKIFKIALDCVNSLLVGELTGD